MNKIDIKKVEDVKELEEFLIKIDSYFPVALSKKVNIKEYAKKAIEKGTNFFAISDNEIIGLCMGYTNDLKEHIGYISTIAVLPQYRKLEVGKNLIAKFKDYATKNNMKFIKLFVHQENEGAIHFYKKNGFERIEQKANYEYNITMQLPLENLTNILLTSVGRRGYLVKYFKEVLGETRKSLCI